MGHFLNFFESLTWDGGGQMLAVMDFCKNVGKGKPPGLPGLRFRTEADKVAQAPLYFYAILRKEVIKVRNEVRKCTLILESDIKKTSYITQIINTIDELIKFVQEKEKLNNKEFDLKDEFDHLNTEVLLALQRLRSNLKREYSKYLLQSDEAQMEPEIGEGSKTKQIISRELGALDKIKGWEYAFASKEDYNIFLNLMTYHFEYTPYKIPKKTIKLKRGCKTRIAQALGPIHKELSEKSLKSDTNFFKLIRVMNHFENLTDIEIYQAITR